MFYCITLISIGNLSINTDKSTNKAFNWELIYLETKEYLTSVL